MQIGTLSGNPVAAVAGLKTMEILRRPGQYDKLFAAGDMITGAINKHLGDAGHAHCVSGHASLFDTMFTDMRLYNYRDVTQGDTQKAAAFNDGLRRQGIFKSPGKMYMSLALTSDDLDQTVNAIAEAAKEL